MHFFYQGQWLFFMCIINTINETFLQSVTCRPLIKTVGRASGYSTSTIVFNCRPSQVFSYLPLLKILRLVASQQQIYGDSDNLRGNFTRVRMTLQRHKFPSLGEGILRTLQFIRFASCSNLISKNVADALFFDNICDLGVAPVVSG